MPDVSRSDTLAILKSFPDNHRRQLLREISGAYQLEAQKAHWVEDSSGVCTFCGEQDSKAHRLLECPTFAHIREPYTHVLQCAEEEGLTLADMAVIHSHADMQLHHVLHHQQPRAIVADDFHAFALQRQRNSQPFNIYVDGSCSNPRFPTSRFAAFAGVIDLADNDFHRQELAYAFKTSGSVPTTFATCFAARVRGFQNIPRAELLALQTAASIPYGVIHSDSSYAIRQATKVLSDTSKLYATSNADVLWEIHEMQPDTRRFHKIKAHRNLYEIEDLLDLYHALGNYTADEAAKLACQKLNADWCNQMHQFHEQTNAARKILQECYQLHIELFQARAQAVQQMTRQDATKLNAVDKVSPDHVFSKIVQWSPSDVQELVFPQGVQDWFLHFSWGPWWADKVFSWMQLFRWPKEPQGPLDKEIGVSWLELALSLSFHVAKCLPILRKNQQGHVRLLMVEDNKDVADHAIQHTDIAATMQKMWAQMTILLPVEATPQVGKGLQTSLYVQGFGQSVSGLTPRPCFPQQTPVAEYIRKHLQSRKSYESPFSPYWLDDRQQMLIDKDWQLICNTFKYRQRTEKARQRVFSKAEV
jgi:ribonuclease HI